MIKYLISNFMKRKEGNVLVMVAAGMIAIMGFSAVSIDVGYMYTAKNQLQSGIDAAALAGAAGLIANQAEATNQAILLASHNNCINEPVTITSEDISFPSPGRIRVQGTRPLDLYFGRVLGINSVNITATAVAEIAILAGVGDVKPWAIPDLQYTLGDQVILKAGELGATGTSSGFFYPVDFPPINRGDPISGGSQYEVNIIEGSQDYIYEGDILLVEPGNMVGPTAQGVQSIIDMDPTAYWQSDPSYETNNGYVAGSAYEGFSSPRIIKIPFYDPNYPPDSGRNTVEIIRFGAFFLEGVQGRNVFGRFMEITSPGVTGGTSSFLMGVKLVE